MLAIFWGARTRWARSSQDFLSSGLAGLAARKIPGSCQPWTGHYDGRSLRFPPVFAELMEVRSPHVDPDHQVEGGLDIHIPPSSHGLPGLLVHLFLELEVALDDQSTSTCPFRLILSE